MPVIRADSAASKAIRWNFHVVCENLQTAWLPPVPTSLCATGVSLELFPAFDGYHNVETCQAACSSGFSTTKDGYTKMFFLVPASRDRISGASQETEAEDLSVGSGSARAVSSGFQDSLDYFFASSRSVELDKWPVDASHVFSARKKYAVSKLPPSVMLRQLVGICVICSTKP